MAAVIPASPPPTTTTWRARRSPGGTPFMASRAPLGRAGGAQFGGAGGTGSGGWPQDQQSLAAGTRRGAAFGPAAAACPARVSQSCCGGARRPRPDRGRGQRLTATMAFSPVDRDTRRLQHGWPGSRRCSQQAVVDPGHRTGRRGAAPVQQRHQPQAGAYQPRARSASKPTSVGELAVGGGLGRQPSASQGRSRTAGSPRRAGRPGRCR